MVKEIKQKKSFGSVRVSRFSPKLPAETPKAINIHISFEEAMRLHLGIGQALAKLNSYDRSIKAGKRSAVNLCVYTQASRITINEGVVSGDTERDANTLSRIQQGHLLDDHLPRYVGKELEEAIDELVEATNFSRERVLDHMHWRARLGKYANLEPGQSGYRKSATMKVSNGKIVSIAEPKRRSSGGT